MSIESELKQIGITQTNVWHNPSYDMLFEAEQAATGLAQGRLTHLNAIAVDTGAFTGRSAQDKYIVQDASTRDSVWWAAEGSDNKPLSPEAWAHLHALSTTQLTGKPLYVIDGYCGATPASRLSVRLITEVAWMAHFFKNIFIEPDADQPFKPDWTILNACKTQCDDYKKWGLRSETYIAFNIAARQTVIGNTWYGGEIKKGIFSMMNYFLPLNGVASLHCSANQGENGDTALFFGLSGTGKTTLLNMIGGLDEPTSGTVDIDGVRITGMKEKALIDFRLQNIGFVFQAYNLIPVFTAYENVSFIMLLQKRDKQEMKERAEELLSAMGLKKKFNSRPSELSGGEQQRVALARALAHNPFLILADEPTGNLDSKTGQKIIELLQRLNKAENKTIIIVTHDVKMKGLGTRRIDIKDGRIQ